jgi:tol-pal system protein YbgF
MAPPRATSIDFISRRVLRSPRMTRALAWLAILAFVATGCATRSSVRRLETDVQTLRTAASDAQQSRDAMARLLGRTIADVEAHDARLAELRKTVREQSEEMAHLRSRLEAATEELRQMRAVATPAPTPTPTPAPLPAPAAVPAPENRVLRGIAGGRAQSADQAYNAALATFRAGEHGQAVLDFLDFIAKYPNHPLAANAQYWIGEAYYAQRDYRQALVEFQKVLQMAPESAKAADALVKVGLCYTNLRDRARAQQAWQRVIREHPRTEAAAKARSLLRAGPTTRS